eukprot:gb/GECH01009423.1/.p1 GENE.gb/GECH01009423.1/~~gb/GECH01009423.1/.p1  ORF type:complete len:867 (+),score=239.63 gb/GECH01009423.1/:1-2601(+)
MRRQLQVQNKICPQHTINNRPSNSNYNNRSISLKQNNSNPFLIDKQKQNTQETKENGTKCNPLLIQHISNNKNQFTLILNQNRFFSSAPNLNEQSNKSQLSYNNQWKYESTYRSSSEDNYNNEENQSEIEKTDAEIFYSQENIKKDNTLSYLEKELERWDRRKLAHEGMLPPKQQNAYPILTTWYKEMGLFGPLAHAIRDMNFGNPTKIQREFIPPALKKINVLASAETGTGKTAAYGLPLLQKLYIRNVNEHRKNIHRTSVVDIILLPTQELAKQVYSHLKGYTAYMPEVDITLVIGSDKRGEQLARLKHGTDIIVATPGRLVSILKSTNHTNHQKKEILTSVRKEIKNQNKKKSTKNDKLLDPVDPKYKKSLNKLLNEVYDESAPTKPSDPVREESTEQKSTIDTSVVDQKEGLRSQLLKGTYNEALTMMDQLDGIDLSLVDHLVVDECDKMLSMGFLADIHDLYEYLPKPRRIAPDGKPKSKGHKRQVQFFLLSATLPTEIEALMKRFVHTYKTINLNQGNSIPEQLKHLKYYVSLNRKLPLLVYLLKRRGSLKNQQVLVFVRTRQKSERISRALNKLKFPVECIHRKISPSERSEILKRFKRKETQVLISTDFLSRGIDVPSLPYVINYDIPPVPQDYVHRIGRTGRVGKKGTAISFVATDPQVIKVGNQNVELNEEHYINSIERFIGIRVEHRKVPGSWKGCVLPPHLQKEAEKRNQGKENNQAASTLKEGEKEPEESNRTKKEKIEQQNRANEEALRILKEKKEKEQNIRKHLRSQGRWKALESMKLNRYTDTYNRLKSRLRSETHAQDIPSLRSFREGRYEDVVASWDTKKAAKRGVEGLSKKEKRRLKKEKKKKNSNK